MKSKFKAIFAASLLSLGLQMSSPAPADDTQLFMLNPLAQTGLPNVVLFWDNSTNWQQPFEAERTALQNAFANLPVDSYNVGLMMFNPTRVGNSGADGAYVRAAVRNLDSDYQNKLRNLFASLHVNDDKGTGAGGGRFSLASYEVWQYYNGLAPYAGNNKVDTDYTGNTSGTAQSQAIYALPSNALSSKSGSPYLKPPSDGCQKNAVIFISNGPAGDNTSDINASKAALRGAGGDDADISLSPSQEQNIPTDEWARFMANHTLANRVKISTYVIDVIVLNDGGNFPGQSADHSAMLKQAAIEGGGIKNYHCIGNPTNALGDKCDASLELVLGSIFQEILAVNSVFAASTLPVNVNVRGQYLNQVYMGLFRPDAGGNTLWPGNLKAYSVGKLGTTGAGAPIYGLVDSSDPAKGIENLDTSSSSYGFIKRDVTSYWSHMTTTGFWDATYYPDAQGLAGVQDAPDGEMVEKGGAAQRLRDSYSEIAGAGNSINDATNGRKLYTCVNVSGATTTECASGNSLSAFPFTATSLSDTALGLTKSATGTISRTDAGLVTFTATNQPFSAGESVTISGAEAYTQASPSVLTTSNAYNGVHTILNTPAPTTNTFSFSINIDPATPATGTVTVAKVGAAPVAISGISRANVDSTTATVTTATPHGLSNGNSIAISGSDSTGGFDGAYVVGGVSGVGSATFTIPLTPSPPAGTSLGGNSGATISFYDSSCSTPVTTRGIANNGISRASGSTTVEITTGGTNLPNPVGGVYVVITGYSGSYAKYNVACSERIPFTRLGNKLVRFDLPLNLTHFSQLLSVGSGGTAGQSSAPTALTSLRRGSTAATASTATASTAPSNLPTGIAAGVQVVIAGAEQPEYNGTFTVDTVTTNSFTYPVVLHPSTPPSGTITATTPPTVTRANLVNWVRGINVKDDDNPNPSTDPAVRKADVRGYLHGDVLHSRPVVVNYNRTSQTATGETDAVIYYGANDGFLHAVQGGLNRGNGDGAELWGFMAPEHFSQLVRLYSRAPAVGFNSPKPYFFDGPLSALTKYNMLGDAGAEVARIEDTGALAQLFAGMRRGGRTLYSLNVTNPDNPKFKWKASNTMPDSGFAELGQTWSAAKVTKVKSCSGTPAVCDDVDVVIFGAGYDPTAEDQSPQGTATMGRGVYVVRASDGQVLWMAGSVEPAEFPNTAHFELVAGMTYPIAADLAVIDRDGDGYVDRIYAPDTGGNVWRINIDPALAPSAWTGNVYKLASLRTTAATDPSNNYRKFLNQPDVVFGTNFDAVLIGSGNRERPFDMSTEDRFYMLKDSSDLAAAPTTITETTVGNQMCDVTNNVLPIDVSCVADADGNYSADCQVRNSVNSCLADSNNRGWFIKLCSGEKVVNTAITLAGAVTFGTNVPYGSSCLPAVSGTQCTPSTGEGRLYMIDYATGAPLTNADAVAGYSAADRYYKVGGGFPPSGTQIVTKVCDPDGSNCKTTNIVCSGSHCLQPPSASIGRRYRIFWHTDADKN